VTREGIAPAARFGSWQDAEELRKWSFQQRTPQQRLDWQVRALSIAYQSGALKAAAADVATRDAR
jgi:hypothetical protein